MIIRKLGYYTPISYSSLDYNLDYIYKLGGNKHGLSRTLNYPLPLCSKCVLVVMVLVCLLLFVTFFVSTDMPFKSLARKFT